MKPAFASQKGPTAAARQIHASYLSQQRCIFSVVLLVFCLLYTSIITTVSFPFHPRLSRLQTNKQLYFILLDFSVSSADQELRQGCLLSPKQGETPNCILEHLSDRVGVEEHHPFLEQRHLESVQQNFHFEV